jgi:hypothetical protein
LVQGRQQEVPQVVLLALPWRLQGHLQQVVWGHCPAAAPSQPSSKLLVPAMGPAWLGWLVQPSQQQLCRLMQQQQEQAAARRVPGSWQRQQLPASKLVWLLTRAAVLVQGSSPAVGSTHVTTTGALQQADPGTSAHAWPPSSSSRLRQRRQPLRRKRASAWPQAVVV